MRWSYFTVILVQDYIVLKFPYSSKYRSPSSYRAIVMSLKKSLEILDHLINIISLRSFPVYEYRLNRNTIT
jgi:hypothetical protein